MIVKRFVSTPGNSRLAAENHMAIIREPHPENPFSEDS